jgi:uncharacterized protein YecE (DUF72 family)
MKADHGRRGRAFVGTSGWSYADWKNGVFYPPGLPQSRWLEYYSHRFGTVEVNNTFYRLPEKRQFRRWRNRVGTDFVFALKMSRFLTHVRRLEKARTALDLFLRNARGLGAGLGPILFQLPPQLHCDVDLLRRLVRLHGARTRRSTRWAIEFRHASWFDPRVYALLETHDVALCLADSGVGPAEKPLTTDWVYLRRHFGSGKGGRYTRTELDRDVSQIREWTDRGLDVYCYFNNDELGHAPRDAAHVIGRLKPSALEGSPAGA